MTDNAPVAGRRRRPWADSRGRYVAPTLMLAIAANPSTSTARPCGDDPFYVSPVGLTCSEHAVLAVSCEEFGSVGLSENDVSDLLRNCPHACGSSTSGIDDDCDGDGRTTSERRLQNDACYTGCQDDPSYRSTFGLACENHQILDCESFLDVGFTEWEVFDLIVSCPCSCRIPCGTLTEAPSTSPSSAPTEDFYRCTDPTCQDDPNYQSKLGLTCDKHARFDCTTMDAINYSEEEISELINRCPCSCRTMCDYEKSSSPSSRPFIHVDASSSPSSRPSILVDASTSPSSRPSIDASMIPSYNRVVEESSRPSPELATESPSDLRASEAPSSVQWSKIPSMNPTHTPITFDQTPSPSISIENLISSVKLQASKQAVDALLRVRQRKPSTEIPSPSPISAPFTGNMPSSLPLASREPSGEPSRTPILSHGPPGKPSSVPSLPPSATPDIPTRPPSNPIPPNMVALLPKDSPTCRCVDFVPAGEEKWYVIRESFDCVWFSNRDYCERYGDSYVKFEHTANTACCVCGGGVEGCAQSSESSAPSAAPSNAPTPSPTVGSTTEAKEVPSQFPMAAPTTLAVLGTLRISERVKEPIVAHTEIEGSTIISNTEAGDASTRSADDSVSKAVPVLTTLLTLTMVGCAVYVLSKKHPGRFETLHGRVQCVFGRMDTILRVARGAINDDDSIQSTKSAVTFAKDLVTVIPMPSPIPMQRCVSFADSVGKELVTELRPQSSRGPSKSLDETDNYLMDDDPVDDDLVVVDDLESSSRSTTSEDDDTNTCSSSSTAEGTFDSADDSTVDSYDTWMSRSGRTTLRVHVGSAQVEIPLPRMLSSP